MERTEILTRPVGSEATRIFEEGGIPWTRLKGTGLSMLQQMKEPSDPCGRVLITISCAP